MHISNLDFKTLTIFSTVMRLRNLSQAAAHLGLTQPAISQAITRLRNYFGDALMVRTGRGMEPTPRAMELAISVEEILRIAHEQLDSQAMFDPLRARRSFKFLATDFGATLMLPKLVNALREEAPGVSVRAITNTPRPVKQQLEGAEVDLAVGGFSDVGDSFYQQLLFRDNYICLAGSRFKLGSPQLSKSAFRKASHVIVAPLPQGYDAVENLVRNETDQGRIAIEVPNFLSLLMVLRETDLLCTVPARVGVATGKLLGLRTYAPPFSLSSLNIRMFWHERLHRDASHRWFRGLMVRLFKAV
jgi:DNA-binding transcriptional LysR family regulator